MIEERFEPDRTVLSLSFVKKQLIKMSDKMGDKEKQFYFVLMETFGENEFVTTKKMSEITSMPVSTTRRYLTKFCDLQLIKSDGKNRGTKYYPWEEI